MAGESTNNPEGMGSNPGRPPLNDQGIGQPNYAPPPPSSTIPDPEMKKANEALDSFFERIKQLEKTTETLNDSIKRQKQLSDAAAKSAVARKDAEDKAAKQRDEVERKYSKYRDAEGKWYAGSEPLRKQYDESLKTINSEMRKAVETDREAQRAVRANTKQLKEENKAREQALATMKEDIVSVRDISPAMSREMQSYFKKSSDQVAKLNEKIEASLTESKMSAASLKKSGIAELLARENAKAAAEAVSRAEREVGLTKAAAKEEAARGVTTAALQIGAAGGVAGLTEIKAILDDITEAEMKRFSVLNPKATEQEAEAYKRKFVEQSKTVLLQRVEQKQQTDMLQLKKKQVEEIMRERRVSREAAVRIAATGETGKQTSELDKRHKEVLAALQTMSENDLRLLEQMKDEDAKAAERQAEAADDVPVWAQKIIEGYLTSSAELKEMFSGIFRKEDGWFTTIILVLTTVIGATVGYIYTYVQKVFGVVSGILKFVPVIGKMVAAFGSGVGSMFGKLGEGFLFVERTLMGVAKGLPVIGRFLGFVPRLLGALRVGFSLASKLFLPLQILISTIDGIIGAFKGFKQMGIRGAIVGAVSQIISGLTFGFLDFQKVFDFINTAFGGIADVLISFAKGAYNLLIKPFVDAFHNIMDIFQGGGNIFSKVLKSLVEVFIATVKFLIGRIIEHFINIPILLLKAAGYIVKAFVWDIPQMLGEAVAWVYEWIVSGVWLDDLLSFGSWLNDKLVGFFTDIINSIADSLGKIPIVGDSIKAALGGGTPSATPAKIAASPRAVNLVTSTGNGMQIANMGGMSAFPAPAIVGATTAVGTANYLAANRAPTPIISAPTTNLVSGGGGGGDSTVIMPRTSRNSDPTLRALLFAEAPAL